MATIYLWSRPPVSWCLYYVLSSKDLLSLCVFSITIWAKVTLIGSVGSFTLHYTLHNTEDIDEGDWAFESPEEQFQPQVSPCARPKPE